MSTVFKSVEFRCVGFGSFGFASFVLQSVTRGVIFNSFLEDSEMNSNVIINLIIDFLFPKFAAWIVH